MTINFEQDRVESVTQIDAAKTLSDKVLKLKELEDEILNAEESIKRLKEKNLNLEIRNDVYKYFRVMTSGLDLNGHSPYRFVGLTIEVHLID